MKILSRNIRVNYSIKNKIKLNPYVIVSVITLLTLMLTRSIVPASAACTPPSPSYGTDTLSVSVSTATTYYVWVQMQTTDATSNSVMLDVGSNCYNVGGSS